MYIFFLLTLDYNHFVHLCVIYKHIPFLQLMLLYSARCTACPDSLYADTLVQYKTFSHFLTYLFLKQLQISTYCTVLHTL